MASQPSSPDAAWLAALPEPACRVGPDGVLTHLNPAWSALRPDDRPGRSLLDAAAAEGLVASDLERLARALARPDPEVFAPPQAGAPWDRLEVATLPDGGRLVRVGGGLAAADLARERELLAAELQTARRELRRIESAHESAGIGFWRLDPAEQDLWWSDEVYRIHGREVGDLPTLEQAVEHYAPHARPVIAAAIQRAVDTGEPWDVDLELDRADGRRISVRAVGSVEREGDRMLLYGAFSDISAQKAQELAAQAKDEQLQFVIHGSNDGHWDWDLTTDEVWYSPRYLELLGYGPGEFQPSAESSSNALHPEDRERVWEEVRRHLEERVPYASEHRMRCGDGSYRWFRARGQALWDADGRPRRMSGASSDITAHVEALRALEQARREAVQADRAKSDFLANMSHEIRTPMAAILGFTDLLLDPRTSAEQQRDYVDTIRRNGEHLLELINDILDLSKIEAGRLEVERIPVAVHEEVGSVVRLMRPRAESKGLTLAVEYPAALPSAIRSDPLRLRQVLTNLVGNAIKFTERGDVTVRVLLEPEARALTLEVADTGIGIPEQARATLFDAFSQADSSTTRRFGGTGLGLTISRRLIEALGGTLDYESTPGAGSTFRARLPLSAADLEAIAPGAARTGRAGGSGGTGAARLDGIRVLLAEDGADNRKLIGLHLRRAGAEVEFAEDGAVAVERLARARAEGSLPDAVLMDMQMPELDGYAATRRLRELGIDLPVVAITAHAMQGDEARCRAAGCDGYLTKPVRPARMVEVLAALLGLDRPNAV